MKRITLLVLVAVFSACSQGHNDPVARGKAYFDSYQCTKCHQVGEAGAYLGPDLTFVGYRKSAEFLDTWLKDPKAWKKNVSMPNFYFKDNVRSDIVAYLASLKGQDYAAGQRPWDGQEGIEKGALIYKHAGCVTCHGKGGVGGYPNNNVIGGEIPKISNVSETYSKEELVEKLVIGVRHPGKLDAKGPDPLLYMPAWGQDKVLNHDELEALADYLMSLGGGATSSEDEW
jgi:mono/diheme cytochrome c family protein